MPGQEVTVAPDLVEILCQRILRMISTRRFASWYSRGSYADWLEGELNAKPEKAVLSDIEDMLFDSGFNRQKRPMSLRTRMTKDIENAGLLDWAYAANQRSLEKNGGVPISYETFLWNQTDEDFMETYARVKETMNNLD